MKIHVWPCGHPNCPVAKPTKKQIEGHEKSPHGVKSK